MALEERERAANEYRASVASGNMRITVSASSSAGSSLLGELVPPAVKAGHYVVEASQDAPERGSPAPAVPPMPTTSGARVKAAPPPSRPRSPERRSDAATGEYDRVEGESSRQRQWRLHGVWRRRGGRRRDEFRPW